MENTFEEHEHILENGRVIKHSHPHTQTQAVLNRMSRLIGHLKATKKMIADGRDCSEVLIQLAAVNAAIKSVSKVILKDHIDHCIIDAVNAGDEKTIENLKKAIDKMLK